MRLRSSKGKAQMYIFLVNWFEEDQCSMGCGRHCPEIESMEHMAVLWLAAQSRWHTMCSALKSEACMHGARMLEICQMALEGSALDCVFSYYWWASGQAKCVVDLELKV